MARRIHAVAKQFPVVVLTGPRQTGKTALLRQCLPEATFLTLDLPTTAEAASQSPELFFANHPEPMIIDEVQYAPGLFRPLKARVDADRHKMGRFYLTGSQKFSLMKDLSESLAGRAVILELDTLSSSEILACKETAETDILTFLWRGGYPELYRVPEMRAQDFYSSYVATYLERDLRLLLNVGSLRDFERFMRSCAARCSQLLNLSDLARDVGIAVSTAKDWMSALEASNQVYLLEPYYGNIGKRMVKAPKLYFRDTGLLCFLLGFDNPQALAQSTHIGSVWECFVLCQLLRRRSLTGSAAQIYFLRDAHGTEVDFLIDHNGKIRLMEAKWTEIPDKSDARSIVKVHPWLRDKAAQEHWIACRTAHSYLLPEAKNVRALNAHRFHEWFVQ
jgi:hypothetical protein